MAHSAMRMRQGRAIKCAKHCCALILKEFQRKKEKTKPTNEIDKSPPNQMDSIIYLFMIFACLRRYFEYLSFANIYASLCYYRLCSIAHDEEEKTIR